MKHLSFLSLCIVLLLLLQGCRPRQVLSDSEMIDILYDLHRAEGIIHVSGHEWANDSVELKCYAAVLQKHGITQADFDSSLVWYTNHPQVFDKLYPEVLRRLEEDRQKAEEQVRNASVCLTEAEEMVVDSTLVSDSLHISDSLSAVDSIQAVDATVHAIRIPSPLQTDPSNSVLRKMKGHTVRKKE